MEHNYPQPQWSKNPNPQPKYKTNAGDRKVQQHNPQNKANASIYLSPFLLSVNINYQFINLLLIDFFLITQSILFPSSVILVLADHQTQ